MFSLTRIAFLSVAACCGLSIVAHAEDVYAGDATVQSEGRNAQACTPGPVKVTVADGRYSFSLGAAPLASGPVAPDGSFSGSYANSAGPGGRISIQVEFTARVQDGKVTGSAHSSSGCARNFTLTKQ